MVSTRFSLSTSADSCPDSLARSGCRDDAHGRPSGWRNGSWYSSTSTRRWNSITFRACQLNGNRTSAPPPSCPGAGTTSPSLTPHSWSTFSPDQWQTPSSPMTRASLLPHGIFPVRARSPLIFLGRSSMDSTMSIVNELSNDSPRLRTQEARGLARRCSPMFFSPDLRNFPSFQHKPLICQALICVTGNWGRRQNLSISLEFHSPKHVSTMRCSPAFVLITPMQLASRFCELALQNAHSLRRPWKVATYPERYFVSAISQISTSGEPHSIEPSFCSVIRSSKVMGYSLHRLLLL